MTDERGSALRSVLRLTPERGLLPALGRFGGRDGEKVYFARRAVEVSLEGV
jgi:hypothetical protein